MAEDDASPPEGRLLVLAPVGRDAQLMQSMLASEKVECRACPDLRDLLRELEHGAGALVLTEEALADDGGSALAAWISKQPPWSDLPVLLLTRPGAGSPVAGSVGAWTAARSTRPSAIVTGTSSVTATP